MADVERLRMRGGSGQGEKGCECKMMETPPAKGVQGDMHDDGSRVEMGGRPKAPPNDAGESIDLLGNDN